MVGYIIVEALPDDCAGVSGGSALIDDCGECHQAYLYDFIQHTVQFVDYTEGLNYSYPDILVEANSLSNPYWNANCNDCAGVVNGSAIEDDCGECHQAYIYNFITHQTSFIDNAELLIEGIDYDSSEEVIILANDPTKKKMIYTPCMCVCVCV